MLCLILASVLTATAAERHALVEEYLPSVAVVKYYLKKDAQGREPKFEIPYKCPNCNNTHWRDSGASAVNGVPAVFAGYVTQEDEIFMQDVKIPCEYIDHITVTVGEETVEAVEAEACIEANALVLKTVEPLKSAKPLVFSGVMSEKPRYFYIADEDGMLVSGVSGSAMDDFTHYVEAKLDLYEGRTNTILIDEEGKCVTLSFQTVIKLGEEIFTPPTEWKREKASVRFERKAAAEKAFASSILPVYIQLEAPPKEESHSRRYTYYSSDESDVKGNDVDATLVAIEDVMVVRAKIDQKDTARIVKMEATLPDGTKEPLVFVGSLADYGALIVKFANGTPDGLKPLKIDRREAAECFNEVVKVMYVKSAGGKVAVDSGETRVTSLKRGKGDSLHIQVGEGTFVNTDGDDYSAVRDQSFIVSSEGLMMMPLKDRKSRWSDNGGKLFRSDLIALVEAPIYDPENVPREADDRRRTPWLGVEVQEASQEVVREKMATGYVDAHHGGSLVTAVYDDSPAAKLGIKEGDILVSARQSGGSVVRLVPESDYFASVDWDSVFENPSFAEVAGTGRLMPWPNVEGGINATLAENFGVGMKVSVVWVSDGKRMEGETALALAPVHFLNAPKARNKELAITVCDMTDEVRKYFNFGADAPGVVVRKVKSGGVAAVSGVLPLEIILEVNGEGVTSAKNFASKTKGKKELRLTVRRLGATRIVPIKL